MFFEEPLEELKNYMDGFLLQSLKNIFDWNVKDCFIFARTLDGTFKRFSWKKKNLEGNKLSQNFWNKPQWYSSGRDLKEFLKLSPNKFWNEFLEIFFKVHKPGISGKVIGDISKEISEEIWDGFLKVPLIFFFEKFLRNFLRNFAEKFLKQSILDFQNTNPMQFLRKSSVGFLEELLKKISESIHRRFFNSIREGFLLKLLVKLPK